MFAPIRARFASSCSRKRNHRGCDGHHLTRRNVHVVDVGGRDELDLATLTADENLRVGEATLAVDGRVGLRDHVAVFFVSGQVVDLVGHLSVDDATVRGLDETERVDAGVDRQRTDQADVRAFRGLDRAHAAVVRRVNVANTRGRRAHGTDHPGRGRTDDACASAPTAGCSGP